MGIRTPVTDVRGQRPRPLDECAISKPLEAAFAGKQGFEPRYSDPESDVLPLDDFPIFTKSGLNLHPKRRNEQINQPVSPANIKEIASVIVIRNWS